MKNASPNKRSAAGRKSKLTPGAKVATKPKNRGAKQRTTPSQSLKDSEVRYRRLFEAAQDGILILDAQTGAIDDVNPYLVDMLGYSRAEFVKKKLWEVGAFKDVEASKIEFKVLQEKGYIRYENLPLRAKGGQLIQVEFVSNVYLAGDKMVIQCNIRDITDRKRLEEIHSEFASIIESSDDAIIGKTLDGIITSWNSGAQRIYGYSAEDVIGRPISVLIPPDRPDELPEILSGIRRGERVEHFETIRLRRDGARLHVSVTISPIKNASGQVVGASSIARDITGRKRTEQNLRESDERFVSSFQNSTVGMALVSPAGKFLKVNPSMCTFTGYSEDELLAKTFRDITHPDDLDIDLKHLQRLLDGKIEFYKMEKRYIHKEGETVWGLLAVVPVRDSEGVPLYFLRQIQDITERKRVEEELRKVQDELETQVQQRTADLSLSNMLLQTLLDNMPDQIYFKDAGSRFIKNSKAQADALGLSDPSQVVGKTDFDFFPHARRSYEEEQEIIRSGKPLVDFEENVVWPDGHATWVSTTKVPLRDQQGKIIGTFGISRDITDRKQNEEALRKASDELEAFSYSVSHDLRAPLRGIDGWSLALLEDYGGQLDEQGQEYIKRVRAEAQHMDQLIDDLLKLSRITRAEMHSDRVDLSAIARSIAVRLQEGEPQRRVEFIIQNGLSAIGDASLLEVMLTNLLSNAFKFTGKVADARIEFGLMKKEGQRVFFVRDNGAGFDMAYAKKLFGVFQRMHKDSEFPGTGIGLATVQRIINRHGGRVWAESAVNQGATFFFTL